MMRIVLALAVLLALAACGFNAASQPYSPGPDTSAGA
jgi:outer membrane lipopolysaccharide assembly protein LptE/RlpB